MRQSLKVNLALSLSTVALFSICFPPIDVSPSAFVCLAPWFVLILRERRRPALLFSWLIGLLFFFLNVAWIRHVTYLAWFALAIYLSLFFLVFGAATQFICRNSCLPMTIAAPVGWVGQEYLRSFMIRGFPWLFVGHTQYKTLSAIQLADLTGVYGISFVIVTVNACIADGIVLWPRRRSGRRIAALAIWTALLLALQYGYGAWRLAQYTPRVGPRICVVQGNTPQYVKMETGLESAQKMLREYEAASLEAEGQPMDLVVWPETMVPGYFNIMEDLYRLDQIKRDRQESGNGTVDESGVAIRLARESYACMERLNTRLGAPLLVGGQAYCGGGISYNSAFYFDAKHFEETGAFLGRYDKIHLVPFGEFLPFRDSLPFLKALLSKLAGYVPDFSHGTAAELFRLGHERFGVLICYEDTIAPLVRTFRWRDGERGADFLLNISNDGWFCGSAELDQHLAICAFRAVENRVAIARSVNTGISGFIAPNGRIEAVLEKEGRRKQVTGALVRPLEIDDRVTVYSVYGETLAPVCLLGWVGMVVYCAISRQRRVRRESRRA